MSHENTQLSATNEAATLAGLSVPEKERLEVGSQETIYFHISIIRFAVMSVISMGIFQAYWIYRNWRYLQSRDGLKISPFWRGIFGVFFCHSLLKIVHSDTKASSAVNPMFSPGFLAVGWILFTVISNIAGRVPDASASLVSFVSQTIAFFFLMPVQNYINRVNESLGNSGKYAGYTFGQVLCILVGMVLWVLVFKGIGG